MHLSYLQNKEMTTKSRETESKFKLSTIETLLTLILVNDYVIKCQSSIPYTLPFCAMFPIVSVWRKCFSNFFRSGNRYCKMQECVVAVTQQVSDAKKR